VDTYKNNRVLHDIETTDLKGKTIKNKFTSLFLIGMFFLSACAPPGESPIMGGTQTAVQDQVETGEEK
jgi:hypothetical protein